MAIITGNDLNNTLDGFDTADTINGNGGDDTINANGGNDIIIGGSGKDTMHGGNGDDTFYVGDNQTVSGEVYDGGDGFDTLSISSNIATTDGTVDAAFFGSTIKSIEALNLVGSDHHYVQFEAANFAAGGFASDLHLSGGVATDVFTINLQSVNTLDLSGWTFGNWDTLIEVIGNDNSNTFTGSSKNDLFVAGAGNDVIHMGAGNDEVFYGGEAQSSTVDGGAGTDTLTGKGPLNDFTVLTLNSFEVINFEPDGVSAIERIDVSAAQFASDGLAHNLALTGQGDGTKLLDIAMAGASNFDASAFTFVGQLGQFLVEIDGGGNAETMTGTKVSDYLFGNGGNDTLFGGSGSDALSGGTGADSLSGGSGADLLNGGSGADQMTGGGGTDTFAYHHIADSGVGAGNRDIITDFKHGIDKIDVSAIDANTGLGGNQAFKLDAGGTFAAGEFRIEVSGSDTILSFNVDGGAADMQIVLQGVTGITAGDLIL